MSIPHNRIPTGVKLCVINVERLLEDAKLLCKNKRYSSAIVSAIIAYEEVGKAIKLRDKWSNKENVSEQDWHTMTNHVRKSETVNKMVSDVLDKMAIDSTQVIIPDERYKTSRECLDKFHAENRSKSDKETYLYVNWFRGRWTSPCEPRMPIPDFNISEQLKNEAERMIKEVEIALHYFLQNVGTHNILKEPDREPIASQEAMNFIREKLGREKGKIGLEVKSKHGFDEIEKITITWIEPILSTDEEKFIEKEVSSLLPDLKVFKINNTTTPP